MQRVNHTNIDRDVETNLQGIHTSKREVHDAFLHSIVPVAPVRPWGTASNRRPASCICPFIACTETNTVDPQATVSDSVTPFTDSRHAKRGHGGIDTLRPGTAGCLGIRGHGASGLRSEAQVCMLIQSGSVSIGEESSPFIQPKETVMERDVWPFPFTDTRGLAHIGIGLKVAGVC